ncbi:MAG TPA: hypothetical protein ENJ00_08765 [Phycisphaerales bacterium]|nr:hypothetical protein [Phycisphaerales bacterium]
MGQRNTSKASIGRTSVIMFLYAALLVTFGVLAYLIAPPGAHAQTAVVVTAICALLMVAMGVLSMLIHKKRNLGMIGIHVGLLLPMVFAVAFLVRAGSAYRSSGVYRYFERAYQAEVKTGDIADSADARSAYLEEAKPDRGKDLPSGDKAYLGLILTILFGVSVAAFVVLLLSRPKLPPKPAAPAVEPPSPPKPEHPIKSAEDELGAD